LSFKIILIQKYQFFSFGKYLILSEFKNVFHLNLNFELKFKSVVKKLQNEFYFSPGLKFLPFLFFIFFLARSPSDIRPISAFMAHPSLTCRLPPPDVQPPPSPVRAATLQAPAMSLFPLPIQPLRFPSPFVLFQDAKPSKLKLQRAPPSY
jgi:hypothetical protein